jgi:Secretion system C-terminal sorting domain
MKHLSAFLALTFLANFSTEAQTLTNATCSAVPGDHFSVNQSATAVTHGPGGAGLTWNFTMLSVGVTRDFSYVAPAATPFAASFPTATVAETGDNLQFNYWRGTATVYESLGGASSNSMSIYTDAATMLVYPCSYGSSWTDTFNDPMDSISGTISGTADAYGALLMPYGLVNNVLRVHSVGTFTFTLFGVPQTITTDTYSYYKPGVHHELVSGTDMPDWLDGSSVGVIEAVQNAIGVDAYPNPANDQVTVAYSSGGGDLTLELVDASGRIVLARSLNATVGISNASLDLAGQASGLYTVRITDNQGAQGMRRLMLK